MEKQKCEKSPSDYCVVDIETTGFDDNNERIIEIAMLRVRNNEVVDQYSQLINPFDAERTELPAKIVKKTGITSEMLKEQPAIEEIKNEVLDFMGDDLLVGHNIVSFDLPRIKRELQCDLKNERVDTLSLAKRLDLKGLHEGLKNYQLETLQEYFHLPKNTHRALADCHTTMELYKLLQEESERHADEHRNVKPETTAFPEVKEDSFFYGKEFAFTGTFHRYTKDELCELVQRLGGTVKVNANGRAPVRKGTDYLIASNDAFRAPHKTGNMKKAEEYKVTVLDEDTFYDLLER